MSGGALQRFRRGARALVLRFFKEQEPQIGIPFVAPRRTQGRLEFAMLRAKLTAALGVMALSGAFASRHGETASHRLAGRNRNNGWGRSTIAAVSGPTAKGCAAPTTTMNLMVKAPSLRTTATTALPASISASALVAALWMTPTVSDARRRQSTTMRPRNPLSGAVAFELRPMSAITERARAKINLTLRVLGRRADGYHLLESLIVFAGVGDGVTLRAGRARGGRDVRPLRLSHRRQQSCRHGAAEPRRRRSQS